MDYAAIADRAVEIIGSADPAQFGSAYDVMAGETVTETLAENFESELAVISRLGIADGITVLETVKAAATQQLGVDTLERLIESERGVNLADPQTIGFVGALVTAGALTQEQSDALLSSNTVTSPKWPGLKRGHVQDALRKRAEGQV
jgi:hypothetical protein